MEDDRLISKEKGENYKNEFELDLFMETSAKTGFNTKELFVEAAKLLYTDYCKFKSENNKKEGEKLSTKKLNKSPKKKCC